MPRWNKQGDGFRPQWFPVQDERGRIVGQMYADRSPLIEDMRTVRDFLVSIQKGYVSMGVTQEHSATTGTKRELPDFCNIVYLAGKVEQVRARDDGSAFALVNAQQSDDDEKKTKFIACTIYDSRELTAKLQQFKPGDMIKLVGYVRAWSQKKDGAWENKTEVRITEIRNTPARRQKQQAVDDEMPF